MYNVYMLKNIEVLEKAIGIAIKNGWADENNPNVSKRLPMVYDDEGNQRLNYTALIFNHDFAKALWGEQKLLENGEYPQTVIMYKGKPLWQPWEHHLQQMVIADDPIKYLGENI